MADYIDRQKLIDDFHTAGSCFVYGDYIPAIVSRIKMQPTIEPETIPIVQELQVQVKEQKEQLSHLEYWELDRKRVLKSAAGDRAAVKAMQNHCEKTIAELRAELKRVTEERDAAIKDRAELADFELTVCEQFCFGDRKHDIPPCERNRFGRCQLREWRGLVAENATAESGSDECKNADNPEKCLIAGYKKPISTFCSGFEPKENVNEH